MLGSGTTFNQLLEYLETNVTDWEKDFNLVFVFLYASSETRVVQIRKYLLTEHPVFRDRLRHFNYLTDKRELPYRKELAYGDIAESLRQNDVAAEINNEAEQLEMQTAAKMRG